MDTNKIFKEIAKKRNAIAKAEAELKVLEDEVKAYMAENGLVELIGKEHTALYREITSNRFDSRSFKKDHAEMYDAYTKESKSMRFNFS